MTVTRGDLPSRRRISSRQDINTLPIPTSTHATGLPINQPYIARTPRPPRWRRSAENHEQRLRTHDMQSIAQSRRRSRSARDRGSSPDKPSPEPQNVELRFSFTASQNGTPDNQSRDRALNQSLSELIMNNNTTERPAGQGPQVEPTRDQIVPEAPFVPELSKPKKHREGYGFSYSETFWCDSDDYPDTECEWDGNEPSAQLSDRRSSSTELADDEQMALPVTSDSGTPSQNESFEDIVVMRDVGSFHMARPQRTLPCTKATREDTIWLKSRAKALFEKFQESSDIQAQLLSRLERMVYTEQQRAPHNKSQVPSITHCALKLRDFLLKIKDERIDTGEHRRVVEHEIEWVKWLVDASRTGVMHLKTAGCKCRPDWEED